MWLSNTPWIQFFTLVDEKSGTEAAFFNWFLKKLFSISKLLCWVKLSPCIGLNFSIMFRIIGLQVWTVLTKMWCRCVRNWPIFCPNVFWKSNLSCHWGHWVTYFFDTTSFITHAKKDQSVSSSFEKSKLCKTISVEMCCNEFNRVQTRWDKKLSKLLLNFRDSIICILVSPHDDGPKFVWIVPFYTLGKSTCDVIRRQCCHFS